MNDCDVFMAAKESVVKSGFPRRLEHDRLTNPRREAWCDI